MKKDLDYYMNLLYTIEIIRIPNSQGGGFSARLPEVGRLAIVGDGETIEEAISSLEEIKRERFTAYLEKGVSIPEPAVEEAFSGNFLLRLPPSLHMALSNKAKSDHLSLNQWVKAVLEKELMLKADLEKDEKKEERILTAIELVLRKQERFGKRIESLEDTISERVLAPTVGSSFTTVTDAGAYIPFETSLGEQPVNISVRIASDIGIEENEHKGIESNSG